MPRLSKIGAAALAAFGWTGLQSITASYLVVAGGGGGGGIITNGSGGGGGAGGLLTGTTSLNPTLSYTVTVGAGGTASVSGSNSVFNAITSTGGGGGAESSGNNAYTGGSGGGGAGNNTSPNNTGAAGTSGQGNAGGTGGLLFGTTRGGGGGGGASAVGANQSGLGAAGAGGAGTASSITGTSVTYAGGGGGGGTTGGAGGAGGGANGASSGTSPAPSGTANLGGGGGGGDQTSGNRYGGSGGSGVVIISYPAPQQFGGGVVTTSGSNVIHTFNTSGTLTPLSSLTASYLIVAGGGGAGENTGGGGGAGGLLTGSSLTIDTNSTYLVTVGAGGAGGVNNGARHGVSGSNSTFSMVSTTAVGGGGGAAGWGTNGSAYTGGSGGGGSQTGAGNLGAAGTAGQGNAGGNGNQGGGNYAGAGGGGAGGAGQSAPATNQGGNGGVGLASSISGTSTYYAGGGGGGEGYSGTAGTGGLGGGGNGSTVTNGSGSNGTANTGGGGGGNGAYTADGSQQGGNGGSGVVIISYAGATQQMAGGTVTISGGNVIHTFTSSGYLTPIKYVNNSLRFRSSASAYLNRTPATTSNSQKFTLSAWVKRGKLGVSQVIYAAGNSAGAFFDVQFTSGDLLRFDFTGVGATLTNAVYRDPAAWYHIVVAVDTTQATSTNRALMYVNGVLITSYSQYNVAAQNATTPVNTASSPNYLGCYDGNSAFLDGYQTEVQLIDGQQLTPNSFGTFNSYGVWQPITYGGSYGTNGFYLPFTGGSSYYGTFNGSNQYLQATLPDTLTGAFTIETFAYRASSGTVTYFCLGDSQTSSGLEVYIGTSGTVFQVYGNNGQQISTTTTVPNNAWSHIAVTRDSSNVIRLFLNGAQVGGTWTYSTAISSTLRIGVEFYGGALSGAGYWNGNMSNFRIINGTALYTSSSFTPPTSALTAVSGTSILTLQSSTIIDNSGNSVSITNNNTVTTAQAYPFTMIGNQSKDYSPNGNNWTNNNIGVVAGTTLDVMTDVPTLTSATAANYPVMNPLVPAPSGYGSMTFSNGNLNLVSPNAASVAGTAYALGTMSTTSGKFYFEVTISAGSAAAVGIAAATYVTTSGDGGTGTGSCIYYGGNGNVYNNSTTSAAFGNSYTTATIGVAFDVPNQRLWFAKDNTYQASGNPSAGTNFISYGISGAVTAIIADLGGNTTITAQANFGQQPFVYTPPTNFVALNTYNL